jgi:hypothetical protein
LYVLAIILFLTPFSMQDMIAALVVSESSLLRSRFPERLSPKERCSGVIGVMAERRVES